MYGIGIDIVNACIDNTDIDLITQPRYIAPSVQRNVLSDGNLLGDTLPSEHYLKLIEEAESKYKSLETFVSKKKIERNTHKHKYIFVDFSSAKEIEWVKHHLDYINRLPNVFSENTIKNFSIMERHLCDFTITLDEILTGKLIERLSTFVTDVTLNEKLYNSWLTLVKYDTPYSF